MENLPERFSEFQIALPSEVEGVEGYLSPAEIRFLALISAYPTTSGEILEIGSFKGKSTIILAKASGLIGNEIVHAVDPMIASSDTDPDLHGQSSSLPDFEKNIAAHDVAARINLHQMRSDQLAETWDKPLRLLWIDGDHTYPGTKLDFDGFAGHLSDFGIIAIHDVLHEFEGGLRVFMEDILLSPNFGAFGLVGSIAWAQYHKNPSETLPFRPEKLSIYGRMSRLIPYVVFRDQLAGLDKKKFKIHRSRVPHSEIENDVWIEKVQRIG